MSEPVWCITYQEDGNTDIAGVYETEGQAEEMVRLFERLDSEKENPSIHPCEYQIKKTWFHEDANINKCDVNGKTERTEIMSNQGKLLETYLKEAEVSKITGYSINTLRNKRHLRIGIPFYKIGQRSVRYKLSDVYDYLESHRVETDK